MTDVISMLKAVVEIFPHRVKLMILGLLLASAGLFLPTTWQMHMGVYSFTSTYRPWEWLVFMACAVLLTLMVMEIAYKRNKGYREIKTRMARLSAPEKQSILTLIQVPEVPFARWPHDPEVLHLHRDGILWREDAGTGGLFTYGLEDSTRRFLNRHPLPEMKKKSH
jgi:Super-infection exclusion protein B